MTTYERVTYRPEGAKRSRSVILRGATVKEGEVVDLLVGEQVDRTGDPLDKETIHVIDIGLVSKRTPLTMNLLYGELEPEG